MKKILLFIFLSVSLFAQSSNYSNYFTSVGDSVYLSPADSTYPAGRLKLFRNYFDTTFFARKNIIDGVYDLYLADTLYQDSIRIGDYRDSRINYAFGDVEENKLEFLSKTKKNGFLPGWAGVGFRLDYGSAEDQESTMELDNLFVRKRMTVYELIINQLRATNGNLLVSDAAKIDSISGTSIWFENPEGDDLCPFSVNDLIVSQNFDVDNTSLNYCEATVDTVDGRRIVVTYNSGTPDVGDTFVRIGNASDTDRQAIIYLASIESGSPYITIQDDISSFTNWNTYSKSKVWLGNLDEVIDPTFGDISGYGMWAKDNIYLTNGFIQLSDSGYLAINKTAYGDSTTAGVFQGFDSGTAKFWVGDENSYAKWDGSTFKVKGNFEVTSGAVYDSLAWMYDSLSAHSSSLITNAEGISINSTAISDSTSYLEGLIDVNAGDISAVAQAVIDSSTSLNTLINANTSAIGGLQATVALKASIITVDSIDNRLATAETGISGNVSDIGDLQASVLLKANIAKVDSLDTRVFTAEGSIGTNAYNIASNDGDINGLLSTVALKANVTTVDNLTGRVSTAESGITANASDIGGLESDLLLYAKKDSLISFINISSEGIDISGDYLQLNGNTTIDGTFTLNGSALVNGSITTAKLSVDSLSAIVADLGTITTGIVSGNFYVNGDIVANHLNANYEAYITSAGEGVLFTYDDFTSTGTIKAGSMEVNTHVLSISDATYLDIKSNSAASAGIRFRNSSGTDYGRIYANSSGDIGFVDSGGSWILKAAEALLYYESSYTGAPGAGVGKNGDIAYDTDLGGKYVKINGSWVSF